jgi:hypothetical protein
MMPGQGHEHGKLIAHDALRDRLRAEHPELRISKTPWGWEADVPGTDTVILAGTLEELAIKLEAE